MLRRNWVTVMPARAAREAQVSPLWAVTNVLHPSGGGALTAALAAASGNAIKHAARRIWSAMMDAGGCHSASPCSQPPGRATGPSYIASLGKKKKALPRDVWNRHPSNTTFPSATILAAPPARLPAHLGPGVRVSQPTWRPSYTNSQLPFGLSERARVGCRLFITLLDHGPVIVSPE